MAETGTTPTHRLLLNFLAKQSSSCLVDTGKQDFAFAQVLGLAQSLPPQLILNLEQG